MIKEITNIFDSKLANQLQQYCKAAKLVYVEPTRQDHGYPHWRHAVIPGDEANGLCHASMLPTVVSQAWRVIQEQYGPQDLLRCYITGLTYGLDGYPHTTSFRSTDTTLVVYLNSSWDRKWGGETILYSGNKIVHGVLPEFNKGFIFPANQEVVDKGVTRLCPEMKLALVFKFAPVNVDPIRNKIQQFLRHIECDQIYHSERRLQTHLLNVYDILKQNGHSQDVCSAGGIHGILGTSKIPTQIVDKEHRDIVAKIVGYPALELVELYRDLERTETLENAIKNNTRLVKYRDGVWRELTESQLNNVCALDAANLYDQKISHWWPHVSKFLKRT
jgi:hypothetical protein